MLLPYPTIWTVITFACTTTCLPSILPKIQLVPRAGTPCDRDGTPILYQDYGVDKCPGKYQLNPDGKTCPMNLEDDCEVFCQTNVRFFYDQEQPAWLHGQGGSHCFGPMTCTISSSETWTWTYSGSGTVTGTIAKVITIGGTGELSYASATTLLNSEAVTLKDNECGYFTFLPLLQETCGTSTLGEPTGNSATKGCGFDITEDDCATFPSFTPDGTSVKGATVFVKINCADNKRLPMDQQNPAYNHDGVAAPQSVFEAWIAELPNSSVLPATTAAPTTVGQASSGPAATPASTSNPRPTCDCNENGCTDNSPGCCANGTCDQDGTCDTPNCD
ncbi:MAG: hypothetical protein Q9216_003054 [Gyalolechia sp. 2 TL-2023]